MTSLVILNYRSPESARRFRCNLAPYRFLLATASGPQWPLAHHPHRALYPVSFHPRKVLRNLIHALKGVLIDLGKVLPETHGIYCRRCTELAGVSTRDASRTREPIIEELTHKSLREHVTWATYRSFIRLFFPSVTQKHLTRSGSHRRLLRAPTQDDCGLGFGPFPGP